MNVLARIARGAAIVIAIGAVTFATVGAERVWRLFGDPDLGPVSFETLERRTTPNDALACPPDTCSARADITTSLYPVSARDLRLAFAEVIAAEPRVTIAATDDATLTDRYIQRSRYLGFPDTVVVRFLDRPESRSTLALYSRSQLGRDDLGVNGERLERWLAKLTDHVPPID